MSLIKIIPSGPLATNAIVLSDAGGHAVLIDPAAGSLPIVIDYAHTKRLVMEQILLTHSHWDHIVDCAEAKKHFRVPVSVHVEDAANLRSPGSDRVPIFHSGAIPGTEPDRLLQEGDMVVVGDIELLVIHTPGHCPGLVCYYCEKEKFLICGDLFFAGGGMGTLAVPTAQPERMWPSLAKIGKLPPETIVYPGHGRQTTLAAESWLNEIG